MVGYRMSEENKDATIDYLKRQIEKLEAENTELRSHNDNLVKILEQFNHLELDP